MQSVDDHDSVMSRLEAAAATQKTCLDNLERTITTCTPSHSQLLVPGEDTLHNGTSSDNDILIAQLKQTNSELKYRLAHLHSVLQKPTSTTSSRNILAPSNRTAMTIRPQFGDRELKDTTRVFEHNAWDNVEMGPEHIARAQEMIAVQMESPVSSEDKDTYLATPNNFWDEFYTKHENKFFKDRKWLFTEFSELLPAHQRESEERADHNVPVGKIEERFRGRWEKSNGASRRVLEVGCAVGNTVFPLLASNHDPQLFVYASDFSTKAIDIVKESPDYDTKRCHAFVCDAAEDPVGLPENSVDVVVLIFVLSAIRPERMQTAVDKLTKCLKPGGVLLFRDYGRYDLAQLRFKKDRYLAENHYVRGDGTQVYFFSQDDFDNMMQKCGMIKQQNRMDKRLIVNRKKQVTMHRCWLQCKYVKGPVIAPSAS
eukprot:m.121868 g.121868  ORF g.121868 m.121868 type:complete len:427 (-) comp28884_c0_seq1:76-1356(-)